ncbi:DUF2635 domain-containing protein [Halomonas sp.]|uniref:DUF2635 domain-containing protein n=1 Tax=Halomonas sp. TaxID=1486246 RepID=UPI00257A4B66|nr:DUF2635 domain-containing protein [Halomonas sp.]MCJ8285104.1 DUF2635 domain-containing protein [Halomonas sp.]NQY70154.1 DUF2635 domain-containing protein [Halomonas sp.]
MTVHKSKRFIKPAREGLVVRQPHNGQPLPAEGAEVDWSGYWMRRMADGSVVKATPPKQTKAKPTPAAEQKEG